MVKAAWIMYMLVLDSNGHKIISLYYLVAPYLTNISEVATTATRQIFMESFPSWVKVEGRSVI